MEWQRTCVEQARSGRIEVQNGIRSAFQSGIYLQGTERPPLWVSVLKGLFLSFQNLDQRNSAAERVPETLIKRGGCS